MPKRTRSHELEDLAFNGLSTIFNRCGWTVERIQKDYGEDLIVKIFVNGKATPLFFFVQSKASDSADEFLICNGRYLSIPLPTDHVTLWAEFWEPVVLTLWDAKKDRFYWETVQKAVEVATHRKRRRDGKTTKVRIPRRNVLDNAGIQRIVTRTNSSFVRFKREREAAKLLIDALRDQLGLNIEYEPQYGILQIPVGRFIPKPEEDARVLFFGRAACANIIIAKKLGISPQSAYELSMTLMIDALKTIQQGEPAIIKGPNGQIWDIWRHAGDVSKDFYQMLEESDED